MNSVSPDLGQGAGKTRDQRLDFFRGLTMWIIFIAHTPGNQWNDWIPARFGFSSGTELFVFCSGCASAGAFGRAFLKVDFWFASAKVLKRIWQIFWVQICLAACSITLAYLAIPWVGAFAFARFAPLLDHGTQALIALLLLQWLPDYLDILPMYLVILAFLPAFELLGKWHVHLPIATSFALWACVHLFGWNIQGNPWTAEGWFLNPFAWQFCFMLGYSFGLGRLRVPSFGLLPLLALSALILLVGLVFSLQTLVDQSSILIAIQGAILPPDAKTNLAAVRMVHFLALAYIVLTLIRPFATTLHHGVTGLFVRIGQQSLAAFVMSIVAAEIGGFLFAVFGEGALITLGVNLFGLSVLLVTAYVVAWFKREPWSGRVPASS